MQNDLKLTDYERGKVEELQNLMQTNSFGFGTCPNCGYCPHCGRGGYYTYPYWPYWPNYPQPYSTWSSTGGSHQQ